MRSPESILVADPAAHFGGIAALLSVDRAKLDADERRVVPGKLRRRFVALEDGGVVGYAESTHYPSHGPGVFTLSVVVEPTCRGRGHGAALFDAAAAFAQANDARELRGETDESALHFAKRRGFVVRAHEVESRLDLNSATPVEPAPPPGVVLSTFADVRDDRALYEINRVATVDNPTSDGTFPAFDVWRALIVEARGFQPEGQILALADGAVVGLSGITVDGDAAETLLTGVAREHRGRGIGYALKVGALRYAREHGAREVVTRVNAENASMLAINDRLGFIPARSFYTLSSVDPGRR